MAKYCSDDARKIIDAIEEYGLTIPYESYFDIEQVAGTFWPNHVTGVITKVMQSGDPAQKIARAQTIGWPYFKKPIESMLTARTGAFRSPSVDVHDFPETRKIYDVVTELLCLTDFNLNELRLLVTEIPLMVSDDILFLSRAIDACKRASARSIFYLHGVIRREHSTEKGKALEAKQHQDSALESAWVPPDGFDKMDVTERIELTHDWQDRLNSIRISQSFNVS